MRRTLAGKGLDAGPHTIAWHLEHHHCLRVSAASISRHLAAAGLVQPSPHKRPKSAYIRFAAEQPNERWQADFTHWHLADSAHVEILCWIDDHSRYALSVTAHHRVTGPIVADEFKKTYATHGIPHSTLTDNGMVFTTRFAGGKGGHNRYEAELHRLGVTQINSTPNHPTTCGKSRTIPPNPQTLAHRPTPSNRPEPAANPTRRGPRPCLRPPPSWTGGPGNDHPQCCLLPKPAQRHAAEAVRMFDCPFCGASPGEECHVRGATKRLPWPHIKRRLLHREQPDSQSPTGGPGQTEGQREQASTRTSRRDDLLEEVHQITNVVHLDDLTTVELELLAALLRPAHIRRVYGVDAVGAGHAAPVLRLVGDD